MGLSSLGWLVFVVGVACENVVWEQYLTYSSPGCDARRLIAQKAFPVASQVCFPTICHNLNGTAFWRSVSCLKSKPKLLFSLSRETGAMALLLYSSEATTCSGDLVSLESSAAGPCLPLPLSGEPRGSQIKGCQCPSGGTSSSGSIFDNLNCTANNSTIYWDGGGEGCYNTTKLCCCESFFQKRK